MSNKSKLSVKRTKEIQATTKERNLIVQEMKKHDSSTVEELSKATGIEKFRLLKHLIAMRQFGKVSIVGERDNQFAYALPKENKR